MRSIGCIDEGKLPSEEDMQFIKNEMDKLLIKMFDGYIQKYEYEIDEERFVRINRDQQILYIDIRCKYLEVDRDPNEWENTASVYFGRFVVYI